jgi:hypothetical protein
MKIIRIAGVAALALAGCAPTLVSGTMDNPAKSKDKLTSTQEYDVGPYRQNHRYYMTLKDWTPSSLGVEVKIAEIGDCAHADKFDYTLVDEHGARHALTPVAAPVQTTEKGEGSATLDVSTLDGKFDVAVAADTHALTVQQRPKAGVSCPALDFHWTLQ